MFVTISLLLAAACLLPAAGKLTGQPKMRKSAAHFGIPWPRYRLIGVTELAAAAGILTGLWWRAAVLALQASNGGCRGGSAVRNGRWRTAPAWAQAHHAQERSPASTWRL